MKKRIFQLGILLIVLAFAVCAATQIAWANPKHQHLKVYVIGDSLSDPGNLWKFTYDRYGPTGAWPPGPPPYGPNQMRFSNGPVWTEYFADKLGVEVDSLAYGGAFTGVYDLPLGPGGTELPFSNLNSIQDPPAIYPLPGVHDEVEELLADHPGGLDPDPLYVIWAGANDFFLGLALDSLDSILAQAVQNIADTVCTLSASGARHFAVVNLPDIGLSPFATSQGPEAAHYISLKTAQFNRDLRKALATLPKGCAKTMVILDSFRFLRQIVRHPEAYGLENVTEPCLIVYEDGSYDVCAEPDKYLFWDTAHPTTAAHALLADHFVAEFCGCNLHYQYWGRHGHWGVQPPLIWRELCHGAR